MKLNKNHFKNQPDRIISALVLTSILSISAGMALIPTATAETIKLAQTNTVNSDRLPSSVANAVLADLSGRTKIPVAKLQIIDYSQQNWSDGCLGLGGAEELCLQAIVEGWRVVVSDGRRTFVYRSDRTGKVIRLENPDLAELPALVADAVLQDASNQSKLPVSKLRIVQAERQEWTDGCLGLGGLAELCAAVIVPGWLVTVEAGQQLLVYRTDENGGFRLDVAASVKPVPIPQDQLPPPLQSGVIFRSITRGGIANLTVETRLQRDGHLIQVQLNSNNTAQTQTSRISRQQVQQFEKLLEQFGQFKGLEYPAPSNAADYFTITLTSRAGTTIYADVDPNRLPSGLKTVIQAWSQLQSQGR